jgi:hypothetical protein
MYVVSARLCRRDAGETEPPTPEQLRLIREVIDPERMYM